MNTPSNNLPSGKPGELLQRYLQAVRFWLPKSQQEDILAELSEEVPPVRDASGQIDIQGTTQAVTSVVATWVLAAASQPAGAACVTAVIVASGAASAMVTGAITAMTIPTITMATATAAIRIRRRLTFSSGHAGQPAWPFALRRRSLKT